MALRRVRRYRIRTKLVLLELLTLNSTLITVTTNLVHQDTAGAEAFVRLRVRAVSRFRVASSPK
jgi:hypothetical protein